MMIMGPEFDAVMQSKLDEVLDITVLQKLVRVVDLLNVIEIETETGGYTREEALMAMRIIDNLHRHLSNIEGNMLDEHFHDDLDSLTLGNAQKIIDEYESGYYRSEIRHRWHELQAAELEQNKEEKDNA